MTQQTPDQAFSSPGSSSVDRSSTKAAHQPNITKGHQTSSATHRLADEERNHSHTLWHDFLSPSSPNATGHTPWKAGIRPTALARTRAEPDLDRTEPPTFLSPRSVPTSAAIHTAESPRDRLDAFLGTLMFELAQQTARFGAHTDPWAQLAVYDDDFLIPCTPTAGEAT